MRLTIRRSVFNDSFYPLLEDNEHDVILLVGGGGSGKSYFSFQRAVCRSIQDRRKYLVVRKSATDLRRSCWVDLKNTLAQFKITSLCKVNETNMTVRLPNDSEFLCMGIDDFEKVKSIPNITDVIIEEASEITFDDYSQLKMRLRGNGTLRNQIVLLDIQVLLRGRLLRVQLPHPPVNLQGQPLHQRNHSPHVGGIQGHQPHVLPRLLPRGVRLHLQAGVHQLPLRGT